MINQGPLDSVNSNDSSARCPLTWRICNASACLAKVEITRTKSNIEIDFGDFIFSSRVNFGPFRRGRYQNGAIGSSPNL